VLVPFDRPRTDSLMLNFVCVHIVSYKVSSLHRDVLLYAVDGGHRAVIFDRFRGVQTVTVGEGTHFIIPWVQRPIIFDIRSQPRSVPTITGSKGL